jgi:putative photosynthetic complex assembly protein
MSTGFIAAKAPIAKAESTERPVISPRLALVMGCLCLAALAIAAFGRLTGVGVQQLPQSEAVAFRDLRFLDGGAGVIVVEDAAGGALVHRFQTGEGGFVRTVMRGMAHERMQRGGDSSTPFRLTLRADKRLTIADPVSGREIILDSFGGPNRDVFARLLPEGAGKPVKAAGAAQTNGGTK